MGPCKTLDANAIIVNARMYNINKSRNSLINFNILDGTSAFYCMFILSDGDDDDDDDNYGYKLNLLKNNNNNRRISDKNLPHRMPNNGVSVFRHDDGHSRDGPHDGNRSNPLIVLCICNRQSMPDAM